MFTPLILMFTPSCQPRPDFQPQPWCRALALALFAGLWLAKSASAEIVIYEFSGSMVDSEGESPFTTGEDFTGSMSIDLSTPFSFADEDGARYDNAIIDFDIEFADGLQLEGISGGAVSLDINFGGTQLVSFFPVTQPTAFSNSTVTLDNLNLRFIDNTSSSLTSIELSDLPLSFDSFTFFRNLQVEDLDAQSELEYRSSGAIQVFSGSAVPEPSNTLLLSVAGIHWITRRKRTAV